MPFITEEIWQSHPAFAALIMCKNKPKSIALARYPRPEDFPTDDQAETEMALVQSLIVETRTLRKEIGVEEKTITPIEVRTDAASQAIISENGAIVERLARVSEIRFVHEISAGLSKHSTPSFDVAVVYERTIDVVADRARLTKEIAQLEKAIANAERQLSNEGFVSKAPPHVVEGLKKQLAENRALLYKARRDLDALPPE
jgi:valyl-tRNA synthetase